MLLLIINGKIIDGTGKTVIPNGSIIIRNDIIEWIGSSQDLPAIYKEKPDSKIIDAKGYTIIPGMIDSHVHLVLSGSENPLHDYYADSDEQLLLRAASNAQKALYAGITTVRDCGGKGFITLVLREAINQGLIAGPRIVASAMPITTTAGHCHFFGLEADTISEVKKATLQMIKANADFIKVMVSGGKLTPSSNSRMNQYSLSHLRMLVDTAHEHDRKVSAHCHAHSSCRNAIKAGVDTIEHCSWLASETGFVYDESSVEKMAEAEIVLCKTMSHIYQLPLNHEVSRGQGIEQQYAHVRKMVQNGVKIIAGTDAGVYKTETNRLPDVFPVMHEHLQISPMEILLSTTSRAAKALGIDHIVGTLEVGKKGDIVILGLDPLIDVKAYKDVKSIIHSGKVIKNAIPVSVE